ncbi:DinB family protein [Leadbetterella byssophila]|uniref:DinB-like domain-containing protein n=1 Tax=Leadbetterella byssophila (strain DSM 17132 / JCM 16389 / KACC 11308 / NBRC 106382 / 4M15) TaxID=649349 RepID=E4RWW1_LEAB4|nr:DinB family protein [Leadbetterella byssophila]ADQ17167.1 hypothetical protein Lbys_1453 [Leadbetterella byssophila DSM 17132]
MKVTRKSAIKTLGLIGFSANVLGNNKEEFSAFREEFKVAWRSSRKYTLELYNQMPEKLMDYKYTPESFSWRTQFVHCIIFNAAQLAMRCEIHDPFDERTLKAGHWKSRKKKQLEADLHEFYDWVEKTVDTLPDEKLKEMTSFGSEDIPVWRLFYALENHIIHHRGQAVCYLRLNGITPIGYVGW